MVWDQFRVEDGSVSTQLNLAGKLVTRNLKIGERTEWDDVNNGTWISSLNNFLSQLLNVSSVKYYPQYFQQRTELGYQPALTVKPNTDGVRYHWQDWSQPIYVKGATDSGLRWDVISQKAVTE